MKVVFDYNSIKQMLILSDSITGMFLHFFLTKNHSLGNFQALHNHIKLGRLWDLPFYGLHYWGTIGETKVTNKYRDLSTPFLIQLVML